MYILGISAYYHDSAAALIKDGEILAAAQEERFTRKKNDASFPGNAIRYCLNEAEISLSRVDKIAYYDKPLLTFERLIETYLSFAPQGIKSFLKAMPVWLKEKLFLQKNLMKSLADIALIKEEDLPEILFSGHHQSHAASAFFPSPFEEAMVLCMDGVGEWATTSCWHGHGNSLDLKWQINFPHSLGLLYSAFTSYLGFKINSGEYKVMGLAPYGEPHYAQTIFDHLIDVKEDGTFHLNMKYFDFAIGLKMTNDQFVELFGVPARNPESKIRQEHMDIARSIQKVTEEVILKLCNTIHKETKQKHLCLAGGVALNCVANGRIVRESPFKNVWIQPAAGDAGGAVGTALATWYQYLQHERKVDEHQDSMKGSLLGPQYKKQQIEEMLNREAVIYKRCDDEVLLKTIAKHLAEGAVVGWFQGRMEFGPRALGSRSILGDPRMKDMQTIMNSKIKFRESFRPFAPSVLREDVWQYFELEQESPYMLLVSLVKEHLRFPAKEGEETLFGIEKLNVARSELPAITHVDNSARVQTVTRDTNPRYYGLLKAFKDLTGCSVLINTSFNVRGEPIVCSPQDAYNCFMKTNIDYLAMENFLVSKKENSAKEVAWKNNQLAS